MNKGTNNRHAWRTLACLLLALMLTVTGASAALDLEADLDAAAIEAPAEERAVEPDLELATVSDAEIAFGPNAMEEALPLESDPAEASASPAPRTADDLEDFETDENGVLTEYRGEGGDVVIPDSVTGIGDRAFNRCSGLTSVTIPDSVTGIGNWAFYQCDGLTSVMIPDSVTGIGNWAFYKCDGLTSVMIPAGVTSIADCAFAGCDKLEAINVADSNPSYASYDGILYTRDMKILIQCPGAKTDVTPPAGVTDIWRGAFYECRRLTSVTLPAGVLSIWNDAFAWCSSLTSVTIPESVTSIANTAFALCDNLTIYGKAGSYAEAFANGNGIPFNVPGPASTPEPTAAPTAEPTVGPDSVSIAQGKAATVYAGQTLQLTAVVAPAGVKTALTWSSSKKSVATVSNEGLVKAVKKGTATVTVKTSNGKKASIRITVPEAPTKVKLTKTKATVVVGGTLNLKARLTPTTARTALTWSSSNKKVATVSDKGVVKGLKKGTATVTVKTVNGKKATCKITVPAAPTKVRFAKKSYSVKVGKSITLKTGLTPSSAQTTLTFSTSDKKVVTVTKKGVVKGVKKGTATITVKTANGKKATAKVTVK